MSNGRLTIATLARIAFSDAPPRLTRQEARSAAIELQRRGLLIRDISDLMKLSPTEVARLLTEVARERTAPAPTQLTVSPTKGD